MRAFVLSGGGTLGAWQVGQLRALFEAGLRPDLLVGTSVGALNAAAVAGDPSEDGIGRLAEIWRATRRGDVFPGWGWTRARALAHGSLYPNQGLRAVLERGLGYRQIDQARVPLLIVATSLDTGEERVLNSGPVVEAVLASTAVPGVFPPVLIGGERLVDGGLVANVPVREAVAACADEIYVLAPWSRWTPSRPVVRIHDLLRFSVSLLLRPDIDTVVAGYNGSTRVVVLPASGTLPIRSFDFRRTAALIEEARRQAAAFLESARTAA